ncbi:hypothetical protein COOONC_18839 [Cooperia oncophora]
MFNRAKKDFRVEVLVPPRGKRRGKHPGFRIRPRVTRPQFGSRCPMFLENDVVVVDHSMKPSTSERSVEFARSESSSSPSHSENKRNRLYAPLSALSSRLCFDRSEQFRHTHSEEEDASSAAQPSTSRQDIQQPKPKEAGREIVFCKSETSAPPPRKPITMNDDPPPRKAITMNDDRAAPSSSTFRKKDIVFRRGFQESRVPDPAPRKRQVPTKDDLEKSPPSERHVHKSETLTVIIPQRRVALQKQEQKIAQSTKSTESSPIVENKPATVPPSNGHSKNKDEMQPVSDDESGDELDGGVHSSIFSLGLIDPPVIKSTISEESFIPYSLDTHMRFPIRTAVYAVTTHSIEQKVFVLRNNFSMSPTKAKFCKDFNAANAILYLKDPKMIKQVDSQLQNLDVNKWMKFSWKVRMKAAMAKVSYFSSK